MQLLRVVVGRLVDCVYVKPWNEVEGWDDDDLVRVKYEGEMFMGYRSQCDLSRIVSHF